ncbi:MAG: EAL domain-containing protein [Candidatus Dormibacteraeota bacterium]|nr:EAL domain-containing protein [Candidatus Dormibacteraeota bacterium]
MSVDAPPDVDAKQSLPQRMARIVAASRSLPTVLDAIVAALVEAGYPGTGLTLVNERDELYIVAYDGEPDEEILALRLPVGRGIMGNVAAQRQTALIVDLDAAQSPAPANRSVGGHARMRSLLAVPIVAGDTVVGVLEVDSTQPGRFDESDQAIFEQVASVIAGVVRDVAPIELAGAMLRRRVEEVLVLAETTRALASVTDVQATFDTVVRYAAIGLGCRSALLVSAGADHAVVVAQSHSVETPPALAAVSSLPSLQRALAGGVEFMSAEECAEWLGPTAEQTSGHAVAVAPVHSGDEFEGAIVALSRDGRDFDLAQLRLLEGVSDLAALAIGNAHRYQRLARAADTDATTGLLTRARFERDLATHGGSSLAVLSIDIDRLRDTNETYGHEAGDAVLEHVAEAFDKLVMGRGPVARTGADEFAVMIPGATAHDATALAEELRASMHGLVPPYGMVRISIGVASADDGCDARAAWSAADAALHRAKRWGMDRVEAADEEDVTSVVDIVTRWDDHVTTLLDGEPLETVFQPIVRMRDRAAIGYEALARPWGAPSDLAVDGLFAAAHRRGLSRELDWLARRTAVRTYASLAEPASLFVNCSVAALVHPVHDVDQLLLLLQWVGLQPEQLVLELDEREHVRHLKRLGEVTRIYRNNGIRFSIDHVGEGRTTLQTLAVVEPEFVKLGRSLTAASAQRGPRSAISAVTAFAHSSGAVAIATGIEDTAVEDRLCALGVEHAQGWLLGRPSRRLAPAAAR